MSNLVNFPDPRKTLREASLWIVSIEEGLTEDEGRELEAWLAADPQNAKTMVRLAETWETFDALTELAEMFPIDRYREKYRRRVQWKLAGVAASVLTAAAALGWYLLLDAEVAQVPGAISVSLPEWNGLDNSSIDAGAGSRLSYETVIGEQLSARLPDGSVVTLNTNSQLDVEYSSSERLVTIGRGEASFNVTRDAARPFRVRAGTRMVQAVGTIFNVHMDLGDRVEVTVSEGRVRVTLAEQPAPSPSSVEAERKAVEPLAADMTVDAGEVAVIDGLQNAVRPIDSLEIEARLAWQQGMLIFRGSPLEDVLADVSRYTTVKFRIADESIRRRRVGGYFRAGDIEALLIALRESFGIEPQRSGDEIVLTARN